MSRKIQSYMLYLWLEQVSNIHTFIHSLIPLAHAKCDDFLLFSEASSIPFCYILFPATLLHQLFFHPPSFHFAIYLFIYLSILLFPNSYIILFWEFCFLPFSVYAQTNVIYLTLLSAIVGFFFNNFNLCSSHSF